jgi:hypothetical protein
LCNYLWDAFFYYRPCEEEDPERPATGYELLHAFGSVYFFFKLLLLLRISTSAAVDARGFMTSHGLPEVQKSARILIKDYIKVACCLLLRLYFHFPPSCLGKTSLLPPAAGRSQRSV